MKKVDKIKHSMGYEEFKAEAPKNAAPIIEFLDSDKADALFLQNAHIKTANEFITKLIQVGLWESTNTTYKVVMPSCRVKKQTGYDSGDIIASYPLPLKTAKDL